MTKTKILYFLIFIFITSKLSAQTPLITADTLKLGIDSKDSVKYSRFQEKMYAHKFTRNIYKLLFRPNYNSNTSLSNVDKIEKNPFVEFSGKTIDSIQVKILNVTGYSVYDLNRVPKNNYEKISNKLHTPTREKFIIKNYLEFAKGDTVNPRKLLENERLIRTNPIFHDARILLSKQVDGNIKILVVVQDVWSLIPLVKYYNLKEFGGGLKQINLFGVGQTLYGEVGYQTRNEGQKYGFRAGYEIPQLIRKTFLDLKLDAESSYKNQYAGVVLSRPFYNPSTRWAGSANVNVHRKLYNFYDSQDSLQRFRVNSFTRDFWIGRSFSTNIIKQSPNLRVNIAVRKRIINYYDNPIQADTNLFQNINQWMFSFATTTRKYQRDVLIYSFGKTEDVPIGSLISFDFGIDKAQFGLRRYIALNASKGLYMNRLGYVYTLFNVGTYFKNNKGKDAGVFNFEFQYFSKLFRVSKGNDLLLRQFVNFYFTKGFNRYSQEYIYLNDAPTGFKGINSNFLKGDQRVVLNLESVFFSNINLLGFRLAPYTTLDLGKIVAKKESFVSQPVYYGFGGGLRLRNENFTFGNIQLYASYYPNLPYQNSKFIIKFSTKINLKFNDFKIDAPDIISFH